MFKTGVELIAVERQRQIEAKGYSSMHDNQHGDSEMAFAACYYAMPCMIREDGVTITPDRMFEETGWDPSYAKRSQKSRVQRLVVAGALIAAEIDRLKRTGEHQ